MPITTLAIELLIAAIQNSAQISQIISNAKSQGRDVTIQELQSIVEGDTVARAQLVIAIANAKSAGK